MVGKINSRFYPGPEMNISQAFNIENNEVISLVGSGGKTTLMFTIARELSLAGNKVITTTTTKIASHEPEQYSSPLLILKQDEERPVHLILDHLIKNGQITVAAGELPQAKKLKGLEPEIIDRLAEVKSGTIIIEADGASRKPLKAPNDTEPVIPRSTTLLIPVIGLDALNRPLTAENVFRAEIAAGLLGISQGEQMNEVLIARLLTHARGITKGTPATARIIPFINKRDLPDGPENGRKLAREIISLGYPGIKKVILGQVKTDYPVMEIIN
jgi:probable selenium-dependent hydroxylase accessory protein YqeC